MITNENKKKVAADPSVERLICSSFPPLDPNGQPFSMVLRGDAAELGDLRATLVSHPNAPQQLHLGLQKTNAQDDAGDKFEDVDVEGIAQVEIMNGCQDGHEPNINHQQAVGTEQIMDGNDKKEENKKRIREDDGDENGIDIEEECDGDAADQEQLLFYLPSVQCTCSSWKMEDVPCDMFVTTLRVLFLSKEKDGEGQRDDVAIDGNCIALHAVDSLPGEDDGSISHHVYCQVAEPMGEESDMGYTSAISMVAPTKITEESDDNFDGDGEEEDEEEKEADDSSEEDGTIEIYLKPTASDEGKNGSEIQSDKCQSIFNALTKLASLNPTGDSDGGFGGGGLFSMLSLMAGIGNMSNGFGGEMVMAGQDDESDDDMVVRLGGSNNLVENDEGREGAPDDERQAMLNRLDGMLVVPPEYEIASSDEGQFEDAEEEDDEDDDIL